MPKVSWVRPKVNYLAALLEAYKKDQRMTYDKLGKLIGCSGQNAKQQMARPADKWTVGQIKAYCDALNIPYEDAALAAVQK